MHRALRYEIGSSVSQEGVRCEKEGDRSQQGKQWGECPGQLYFGFYKSLPLRSLLDSRRMRRKHTGRVSKDAYEAGQGAVKWFHHGCITILVVSYLKRYLELSTERSHLSNAISYIHIGTGPS